jgi:hypothetical protein
MNYKQRVIEEAFNLFANIIKLDAFMKTDLFNKLDDESQKVMVKQFEAMHEYYQCLRKRIDIMLSE